MWARVALSTIARAGDGGVRIGVRKVDDEKRRSCEGGFHLLLRVKSSRMEDPKATLGVRLIVGGQEEERLWKQYD